MVGIDRVRQVITIIPQDPTLFAGSLRFNIDPENRATNKEVLTLLNEAGLSNLLDSSGETSSEAG